MELLGQRSLSRAVRAAMRPHLYRAALNMFRGIDHPMRWSWRYLTGQGTYPASAVVSTPSGPRTVQMWTRHDLLTVNEMFLTGAPQAELHLFEPVPFNVERLTAQLPGFGDRYVLHQVAVGAIDGEVSFGLEETGRYGGIGKAVGRPVLVPCRSAETVLAEIIAEHGRIDLLKIDVEGHEQIILECLSTGVLAQIDKIYAERRFRHNPLPRTHHWTQRGGVATFQRRDGVLV